MLCRLPIHSTQCIRIPKMCRIGNTISRGRTFVRRNTTIALLNPPAAQLSKKAKTALIAAGGMGTFGLLSLMATGFNTQVDVRQGGFEADTRVRLRSTYGYVIGGLSSTALFATAFFRSGVAYRIANVNPLVFMGVSLIGTITAMMVTRSIDIEESPVAKHAAWMAFNGLVALSLCTLGAVGGQILFRAGLATGAIVGSLSGIAACAPSEQFLGMGGYLGIGLGVVIAASFGQFFFPASSLLYNVALYGGLGLFSLMTLYDTQVLLTRAKNDEKFDGINASFGLYLDTINIFVRMVQIMAMNKRRR